MKIDLNRKYNEALKNLRLTDNTNNTTMEELFISAYDLCLDVHKESDYQFIVDQRELDKQVLQTILNVNKFSICDSCNSIQSYHIDISLSNRFKCDTCI